MGTQTFNSTACFTVPARVKTICVQAWGQGGQGGGGWFVCCAGPNQGPGGGGGGYAKGKVPVTPGAVISVKVAPTGGIDSKFTGNCGKLVGAHGGGTVHGPNGGCLPGCGGSGFVCGATCTTIHTGSNATNCGGTGANPCGGAGGLAKTCGPGNPGLAPGGGGGGVLHGSSGSGAAGRVVLTWCCVPALSATASACPTCGKKPLCVHFSACPAGGVLPYNYSWHFGDGGTSAVKTPTHQYTCVGTFNPSVKVGDACSESACPAVPAITVKAASATSGSPKNTGGTLGNFYLGRRTAPKLSTSLRIVNCSVGGGGGT
jgi:hypothetical protein